MQSTLTRRVVTTVAITAGAALLVVCVLVGAGASSSAASPQPTARGEYSLDFVRVLQLVADLRARPPAQPLVCLLGGSSARECTVSNDSWSDRVSSLRGYRVKCVNLGSKHRMFTQDRRIVGYLPQGTDIVYVGVNAGRFCNGPYDPAVILPEPSDASATAKGGARPHGRPPPARPPRSSRTGASARSPSSGWSSAGRTSASAGAGTSAR